MLPELKNGLWYFAHPYSVIRPDGTYVFRGNQANFQLCCYRAGQLSLLGYVIYSPIAHTHSIQYATPEFMRQSGPEEHNYWIELDLELIRRAGFTGIILAPGWEDSRGCKGEKAWFDRHDRKVLYYDEIIKDLT